MSDVTKFAGSGAGWNDSENITADDESYANKLVSQDFDSVQLIGYNFGFSIPTGATIDGVVVTINAKASTADNIALQNGDAGVTLGAWNGVNFTANGDKKTDANLWTQSDVDYTLGSSSDKWGAILSSGILNSNAFAVKILVHAVDNNATAYVDAVKITVYYTISDYSYSASGGLTVGGSAVCEYIKPDWEYVATGGAVLGGTATYEYAIPFEYIASGGLTAGGSAISDYTCDYSAMASGGLTTGGTAVYDFTRDYQFLTSGGLITGGEAVYLYNPIYLFLASGGLLIGGEATYLYHPIYLFLASGGLLVGGVAEYSVEFGYIGSGLIRIGGEAVYIIPAWLKFNLESARVKLNATT